tara:strand:- start:347 stop:859 length:513 start_codon:yes stop_codon:yes gene_type:complete
MFTNEQLSLASNLLDLCKLQKIIISTAESCTGGLIASCLTEIPGSSDVFDRGFIAYHNSAKNRMLNVSESLLLKYGAVSSQVAIKMAEGAVYYSRANLGISCTGIAGPKSDNTNKPIGLVYIACSIANQNTNHLKCNFGKIQRSEVRQKTLTKCLNFIISEIEQFKKQDK